MESKAVLLDAKGVEIKVGDRIRVVDPRQGPGREGKVTNANRNEDLGYFQSEFVFPVAVFLDAPHNREVCYRGCDIEVIDGAARN